MVTTATFPSIVDHLVEQLFQRILSGEYAPGSRLTEEQIAGQSGASRTPVREAVRRLAELGLLVVRPRYGLEVVRIEDADVAEIRSLRSELESFALRLAVPRLSDQDVASLDSAQRRCEELLGSDNRLDIFRRDSAFHLEIVRLSGNRYLHETLQRLDAKVLLCRMLLCQTADKIRSTVEYHRTILDAIRRRDIDKACEAMRRHIESTQM